MSTDKELEEILSLIKTEKYYKGAHSERITGKAEAKAALKLWRDKSVNEAIEKENEKLIKQCQRVAKVFESNIRDQKVTLESVIYYANKRLNEILEDGLTPRQRMEKLEDNLNKKVGK